MLLGPQILLAGADEVVERDFSRADFSEGVRACAREPRSCNSHHSSAHTKNPSEIDRSKPAKMADDWPEDEFFPTQVRLASGEETTIRLAERAILLGNQR
jgi:hypothetical protein